MTKSKTTPTKITTTKGIIEFEMTLVIPTMQYGNAQPVIKGYGKTYEEARDDALVKARDIWAMIGEGGKTLEVRGLGAGPAVPASAITQTLKCYVTGQELFYDDAAHSYIDENGDAYLSGSNFAHQFSHEFNKAAILPAYAKKNGVQEYEVDEYWTAKGLSSTTFGTAIHQAMETYGTHIDLANKLGKDPGVHPLLLPIVEDFFERFPGTRVFERFVMDKESKHCGRIDSLVINEDGSLSIEDFKTNVELHKKRSNKKLKAPYNFLDDTPFSEYILQLNFYRDVLEKAGKTVLDMNIKWLNPEGEWEPIDVPRVEIAQAQEKIDVSAIV